MNVKATISRPGEAIESCRKIALTAARAGEPEVLAAITRVILHGGTLRVTPKVGDEIAFTCDPAAG